MSTVSGHPKSSPKHLMSNQTVTGAWADMGAVIESKGANSVGIWIDLDINDAKDFRIRALGKMTKDGDEYVFPIRSISATVVKIEAEYLEFATDADQKVVLEVDLSQLVPFVRFEIMAGTVGAAPAIILQCDTSLSMEGRN